jgi:hypothetical protein
MAVKSKEQINQRNASTDKGFGSVERPQPEPEGSDRASTDTTPHIHDNISQGLSLVLTGQIQQAEKTVEAAENFTTRAAKDLAKRTHRLASGESFASKYIAELNALCEESPFGGFGQLDLTEAEAILERMGKPALPSPKPNFLPSASR